jgi:hypothetical protein
MVFLPLDLLARVMAMRIDAGPLFMRYGRHKLLFGMQF